MNKLETIQITLFQLYDKILDPQMNHRFLHFVMLMYNVLVWLDL